MRHLHAGHPGECSGTQFFLLFCLIMLQSQAKVDLIRMLGAEVHAVPAVPYDNPKNYNHLARDYAESIPNAIWTDQFDNTANAYAHYISTGPEIWEQTQAEVHGFICSTGTGGSLAGIGRYLKEKSDGKTEVWLADPPGSVLYNYVNSGGKLIERSGSSITEGELVSADAINKSDRYAFQVLARDASRRIWGPSLTISRVQSTSLMPSPFLWCTKCLTPRVFTSGQALR